MLQRVSTAIIFVAMMLAGLYGGQYSFFVLFAFITGICLWEFFNLVLTQHQKRDYVRRIIGVGFGLTPFILTSIVQLELIKQLDERFVIIVAILFFPFVFMAFIYELYTKSEHPFLNVAYIVLGMIYIGAPFALLDFIAFDGTKFYANTVFGLLLLTWSNDTGAYLIGSRYGKTPLLARISPKKTWEGFIGGIIVTFIVGFALGLLFNELRMRDWIALAGIVAVFGSYGDLVESMLKRSVAMKDSGTILPGHGGLLDRFDAFIFILPFAAAYLLWIR